jgi:hypothetical protein
LLRDEALIHCVASHIHGQPVLTPCSQRASRLRPPLRRDQRQGTPLFALSDLQDAHRRGQARRARSFQAIRRTASRMAAETQSELQRARSAGC